MKETPREAWDPQQEAIGVLVAEFERGWHEKKLAATVHGLPQGPTRQALLLALVEADIRLRWGRRQKALVETYLRAYPELGDSSTVPARLLLAEFRARQEVGYPTDLAEYDTRFPLRASELRGQLSGGQSRLVLRKIPPAQAEPLAEIQLAEPPRLVSEPGPVPQPPPPPIRRRPVQEIAEEPADIPVSETGSNAWVWFVVAGCLMIVAGLLIGLVSLANQGSS